MSRYDSGVTWDSPAARWDEPDPAPSTNNQMSQNLISQTMTDAQRDAIITDVSAADTKFANYKVSLTAEQIKKLSKLAATDIALLDLAATFAAQNAGSIPADVNVAEFSKDIALAKQLAQVDAKAQPLAEATKVSLISVMSDGYTTAREIYRIALARGRTPQTIPFLDAFGARFGKNPPASNPPTP
jgi:hypothetical protein